MPGNKWIWLPVALLGGVIAFTPLRLRASLPIERLIHVDAGQFAYNPGEIHVNNGDIVTLELSSTDVVHGLYLDGYDISITADPGQTQRLTFTADRPGSFRFRCNVTCGAMHPFMIGRLSVGPNQGFLRGAGLFVLATAAVLLRRTEPGVP
jgi:heme/copper-type cytochrome/quinol oxidase subunit 2